MVIGFDGSRAFDKNRTGTENYSYQLLKNLAKIDTKNQYIVYLRPKAEASFAYIRPGVNPGSVWPIHPPFGSKNFQFKEIRWPRFWTQGGLALQTFKDQLDVLFVPAHTVPVFRRRGLKTVVTVHDLGSEYLPAMHQLKQRAYLSLMQKYQLKGATKIIAVSKATKRDLVKKIGLEPEKIAVVYEGYDQKLFKPVKSDALVDSLIPYFLFVGTIQPRKNLERVIRAFSMVAAPNLVIVGSKGWMSEEIYKLPKKLGIQNKVKFLGYVPDKDLPVLYSGAQALVFPSLFEGFGLPLLEAQACGCPLITSNLSSMPEVAGKGAILVDPYDVKVIAHAMIRLQGTGYRGQLIKKGFENIKRFSWEKCARETLKVLEEI